MFSHVLSRSWLVDLVDLFPMALQVRSIAASDRAFAAVLADGRREVAELPTKNDDKNRMIINGNRMLNQCLMMIFHSYVSLPEGKWGK